MVYKIVEYNLIGKKLHTFEEMPNLELKQREGGQSPIFVEKGTNREAMHSHLWHYSATKKEGAFPHTDVFLPYFADVTEDLPGSCRYYTGSDGKRKERTPKTYHNCQLLTQKHGGYLEFYHDRTKKTLRIAMNSNYYKPV